MAEGARLESVYTATYPGFESPPHRHIRERARTKVRAFFFACCTTRRGEKPGPGFDNWRSQLDRPRTQRTGCPKGERSESIPASPPYFKTSSYESTGFFFVCCSGAVCSPHPGPLPRGEGENQRRTQHPAHSFPTGLSLKGRGRNQRRT